MTVVAIIAEARQAGEQVRRSLQARGTWRIEPSLDGRRPCWADIARIAPDLIVIDDLRAPRMLQYRIREARSAAPTAKIIVLAVGLDAFRMAELVAAGADAAIARQLEADTLAALVRAIQTGTVFHAPPAINAERQVPRDEHLTPRELETLRLVAGGLPNTHVARRMRVSERTVAFHLSNVYRKLGVANRTEASHYAHMHGLLADRMEAGSAGAPAAGASHGLSAAAAA
jgi:DNA-binding NarL/FixJ family response regulator